MAADLGEQSPDDSSHRSKSRLRANRVDALAIGIIVLAWVLVFYDFWQEDLRSYAPAPPEVESPYFEHVYAVGDVIGFPSLAATSMEQGRIAASCALGESYRTMGELLPIGIYTIPETSFVGKTEEELTEAAIPYEIGVARYRELARGQILGDAHGILKLLISAQDRTPLSVHAFGTSATEVIHIGQAVMAHG